ncbi:unnamed protein product [Aphanomyces euteiches]|uniref:Uncharacterized protein n=1 Tax=Aphanomyces euteiches TaxID=100861 RepID=A0A6G0WTC9_9STRA|nr:hypothetical protein Ae201684_011857 [Aphanomyces euteiches]KAH9089324.1 hypothetical protein Ae201684P_001524 [Aphanomyces euteiches]KAH9133041.1 hypothetical protein AeRB84_020777 [Aphanomyces euteiches]
MGTKSSKPWSNAENDATTNIEPFEAEAQSSATSQPPKQPSKDTNQERDQKNAESKAKRKTKKATSPADADDSSDDENLADALGTRELSIAILKPRLSDPLVLPATPPRVLAPLNPASTLTYERRTATATTSLEKALPPTQAHDRVLDAIDMDVPAVPSPQDEENETMKIIEQLMRDPPPSPLLPRPKIESKKEAVVRQAIAATRQKSEKGEKTTLKLDAADEDIMNEILLGDARRQGEDRLS